MWLLMVWVALAGQAQDLQNPAATGSFVLDQADVFIPEQEAEITRIAQGLYQDLGVDLNVVVVASVEEGTTKELATEIFDTWRIGDPQRNTGLLILVSLEERRMEMETGYGLESTLSDGWLGAMQQQDMVPSFKEGYYGDGLLKGVEEIDIRLRDQADLVLEGAAAPAYDLHGEGATSEQSSVLPIAGGTGGAVLLVGAGLFVRRRRRTCFEHDKPVLMEKLSEVDDDEHLTEGEIFEEEIGSVQYDIYVCPDCDAVKRFSRSLLFSGFSRCSQCGHRTNSSSSVTLESATYHSSGLREVTETCLHCDFEYSYTQVIPQKVRASSTGGGGGGGGGGRSGGGRSGGGGAGSSW
ncbi:MAG: hypothetical protein ACI9VR_002587 [Cognaticolwellia sp.]|jgi:uncharacterized protein